MTAPPRPSPALFPHSPRGRRRQLDVGGPMRPGHHLMLSHIAAGRVEAVDGDDGHRRWVWTAQPALHVPRPLRWYLDELVRAGRVVVDDGTVTDTEEAA